MVGGNFWDEGDCWLFHGRSFIIHFFLCQEFLSGTIVARGVLEPSSSAFFSLLFGYHHILCTAISIFDTAVYVRTFAVIK